MELNMTTEQMELFFSKALSDVYSRPKRPVRQAIRTQQKLKVKTICSDKSGMIQTFFNLIRHNGCSDDGTPVWIVMLCITV